MSDDSVPLKPVNDEEPKMIRKIVTVESPPRVSSDDTRRALVLMAILMAFSYLFGLMSQYIWHII